MFHSSSFRHEQYIRSTISNSSKATLHKKRSSLESEGADSGYNSSSSISPPNEEPKSHVTKSSRDAASIISSFTMKSSTISTFDDTSFYLQQQKKKSKSSIKHQPPRQPDLVYSCPRPLAFPFHNDDHFLPIAEADPRDVARVSPLSSSSLLNRSSSLNSTSSSTRLLKKDTESQYSRHSSILSTIQRGTVRSLRSLFQIPDSDTTSRVQTNYHEHNPIKQGTVQSIKNIFKRPPTTSVPTTTSTPPPVPPKIGKVTRAVHQFEAKQKSPVMGLKVNVTPSTNNRKSTLSERAKDLKSKLFNKAPTAPPTVSDNVKTNKLKTKVKNLSNKVFNWKQTPHTTTAITSTNTTTPNTATPKPKKSIFAAFKKSSPSTTTSTPPQETPKKSFFSFKKSSPVDTKKQPINPEQEEAEPTRVKKMWKSFKNLVTGKKSSRIGIM